MVPIAAILGALTAGAVGGAAAGHAHNKAVEAAAAKEEHDLFLKKAEKVAEQGDHETYEKLIPHLQQAGISPNAIAAGRTIARSKAEQIYRREAASGEEPSVTPPPNLLSSMIAGQSGGNEASDYFDNATSDAVTSQRGAAGLPPIDQGTAEFRARGMLPMQPPAPAPQPATGIHIAPARSAETIQTPTGTKSIKETTGKQITEGAISSARLQNLPPNDVVKALDIENAKRADKNQPPLDIDQTAIEGYRLEHFETVMNGIRRDLESQNIPPSTAMGQAIQKTYDQTGIIPEKYKSEIIPKPGQIAAGAYIHALDRVKGVLSVVKDPKTMKPGFLSDAINETPNITPEDSVRAHHTAAEGLVQSLIPKLKQQFPNMTDIQRAGMAVQLSSYAVGGQVPKEWNDMVMSNPTAFGFSQDQVAAMAASGINPLEAGAGARAQDIASQIQLDKDYRKRSLEQMQTPEGLAAAYEQQQKMLKGKPTTPAPAAAPGPTERAVLKEQKGALSRQDREQEQEFSKMPSGEHDKLAALDNIYTTGVRLQQLVQQKDASGQTLLDKYGNTPGTFVDWYRKASGALGQTDPQLRKYTDLLGKIFNVEKKTFAGVAVNVAERKDLLQFMPDPTDNVRTGLQKINDLVQMTGLELQNKIEYNKTNYPKTDFSSFGHQKIRAAREAQKEKK